MSISPVDLLQAVANQNPNYNVNRGWAYGGGWWGFWWIWIIIAAIVIWAIFSVGGGWYSNRRGPRDTPPRAV